jgi:outer membrane protein assembly factor BamB
MSATRTVFLSVASILLFCPAPGEGQTFVRGDANGDGLVTQVDSQTIAVHLFAGAPILPPLERADVNDNEWITYADVLFLSDHFNCQDGPQIPPPSVAGDDPDDAQDGFDAVDPDYEARAIAELTIHGISIGLRITPPSSAEVKAATLILEFDASLDPQEPIFCPAEGVVLVNALPQGSRLIITVQGGACGAMPRLDPQADFIDLGTVHFAHDGGVRCSQTLISLLPDHDGPAGIRYRATIVDAQYRDHNPLLMPLGCTEALSEFLRGDSNGDGSVDIADPIFTLFYLFARTPSFCLDSQDANDDGKITLADPIYSLGYLFAGGPEPPLPFHRTGADPTIDAPCAELGCGPPPKEELDSPWPMFRHDLKHTGRTRSIGPSSPTVAWTFHANDGIVSSPSISANGTIYFGAGWFYKGGKDHHLYAIHPNGTLKWSFAGGKGFFSSPALGPGGSIYLSGLDGDLYAVEDRGSYGRLKWRTPLGYLFSLSSPAIGSDGTIYVGSPDFSLYAIHPNGSVRWFYGSGWCIISSPAIGDDGTVYIGSKDHSIYAFPPEGEQPRWHYATGVFYDGHLADSSPAIGADGTIYFGTDPYGASGQAPVPVRTNFWAVHPAGTLKWVFETEDGVESSPAIGSDGTIYFGSYDTWLYAVTDNGAEGVLKWKFKTGGAIEGGPVVDGAGTIYVGSRDSMLYALHPDGSLKWAFPAGGEIAGSPTIDDRGFLYVGCLDGSLYAIGTEGLGK